MPFSLKNAGATYQRLMNKIFEKQVGKCMEVYVNDIVVKFIAIEQHLEHLKEVFGEARRHGIWFNPEKCTFGVAGGKFLEFMLSERGIQENPDKCQDTIEMTSPWNIKEVQRLDGQIAALARFLPIMVERSWPFIDLLKKSQKFSWSDECEEAFLQYKIMLATSHILTKPKPEQDMIVYLVVSDNAISSVLLQETPEPVPVYFISRTLQILETRYQLMEKVVLALIHTARRLRHYFQSHQVVVRTNYRSLNRLGSRAEIILEGPNTVTIEQSIQFEFKASNNQAEYEALLAGLRLAKKIRVERITCWSDSKIVAEQVNETYQVKDSVMLQYYQEFKNMEGEFDKVHVRYTPRTMNEQADKLARLASQRKPGQLQSVIHQEIHTPSISKQECMNIENRPQNWMTSIIQYLTSSSLPNDPTLAKKIRIQAAKYILLGKELYKRGISTPMLKCLDEDQASYVMRKIREGICGTHSGGRTMATKILRVGYFCLTLSKDCHIFVKKCIPCQQHDPHIYQYADTIHPINWRFNEFLEGLHIKHKVTFVEHPQSNGQAEAANKETPFRLTYGIDAMVPVEIGEPSFRRQKFEESANRESLVVNLDLLDEVRGQATIVAEASKRIMAKKFNSKINPRQFYVDDLVWRVTGEERQD
ncbi:uncharacterized protein LOC113857730 [Abrus precatorius]|uniref:Uncharacterized protein LOC113857730 n=1 Tax=Abrus precatorius TaxID=3816 RepID=A0A8B8KPC2_ABRPR|nr:uncharacterized protein LOC113857730 [Abrus precatorius]